MTRDPVSSTGAEGGHLAVVGDRVVEAAGEDLAQRAPVVEVQPIALGPTGRPLEDPHLHAGLPQPVGETQAAGSATRDRDPHQLKLRVSHNSTPPVCCGCPRASVRTVSSWSCFSASGISTTTPDFQ